jgi:hypothetical protein
MSARHAGVDELPRRRLASPRCSLARLVESRDRNPARRSHPAAQSQVPPRPHAACVCTATVTTARQVLPVQQRVLSVNISRPTQTSSLFAGQRLRRFSSPRIDNIRSVVLQNRFFDAEAHPGTSSTLQDRREPATPPLQVLLFNDGKRPLRESRAGRQALLLSCQRTLANNLKYNRGRAQIGKDNRVLSTRFFQSTVLLTNSTQSRSSPMDGEGHRLVVLNAVGRKPG